MAINTTVCEPWPFEPDCCTVPADTPAERLDRIRRVATALLWRASGMRWGPSCPIEVRPCRKSCMDGYFSRLTWGPAGSGGLYPYILDGQWYNASPCGCTTDCSCTELCEIRLDGPVYDIVSVREGATVLPPAAYRVDNGSLLVRTDGNCWPDCQAMDAAPGEPDTLTVTYRTGLPLDDAALYAYSALVCHMLKSCGGSCGCSIASNRNVTRVSRQGVDMEFEAAAALYTEGRFGIPEVDRWLMLVNPYRLTSASRVLSVDRGPQRVTTWRP